MKQAHVEVEQVRSVQPAQPTPLQHYMYLSGVDLLLGFSKPSRTILFYSFDDDNDVDVEDAFTALQHGLAAALVPYYPFAGRLARLDDSSRFALHCNDAGVELVLARCDDIPFSDLASNNFSPRPLFHQLVPMDNLSHSVQADIPVTAVQLTAFRGGLTVGVANLHTVADGFSFWMFIKTLSQACRKEPLTVQPLHYRALLKPETVMLNKFPPNPLSPKPNKPVTFQDSSFSYSFDDSTSKHEVIQLVVHFSKEMIDSLKKACASGTSVGTFSTYQALSAYLWKRYLMAREIEGCEPVQILHLLDMRQRIVPPLTTAFCGNAIAPFFTVSTAQEVMAESLGATATRIRQTIQEVDDYAFKSFLVSAENLDLPSNIPINMFRLRNASHFPVYEAGNFGWGEPAAVRPPISDTEGEATWYPSKGKPGGLDVVFALLGTTCSRYFSPDLYANDPLDVKQFAPNYLC